MWRFLAGGVGALLLAGSGLILWQQLGASPPLAEPPAATEKTREEKRFLRYDKDRDGKVAREEFLASRRKAYAKLDANSDGRLSFEEWSAKTSERFAKADADKSATLTAEEFATTRIARKATRPAPCVPDSDS